MAATVEEQKLELEAIRNRLAELVPEVDALQAKKLKEKLLTTESKQLKALERDVAEFRQKEQVLMDSLAPVKEDDGAGGLGDLSMDDLKADILQLRTELARLQQPRQQEGLPPPAAVFVVPDPVGAIPKQPLVPPGGGAGANSPPAGANQPAGGAGGAPLPFWQAAQAQVGGFVAPPGGGGGNWTTVKINDFGKFGEFDWTEDAGKTYFHFRGHVRTFILEAKALLLNQVQWMFMFIAISGERIQKLDEYLATDPAAAQRKRNESDFDFVIPRLHDHFSSMVNFEQYRQAFRRLMQKTYAYL